MGLTERTIFEQFPLLAHGYRAGGPGQGGPVTALLLRTWWSWSFPAAIANAAGRFAIGVPGGEWVNGLQELPSPRAGGPAYRLPRSGETTENDAAAKRQPPAPASTPSPSNVTAPWPPIAIACWSRKPIRPRASS